MATRRFGITARLVVGFGFMLVLMAALTWVAVVRVESLDARLQQINEVNSVKQRFAINFRGSVHDRAIAIRDVAMLDGAQRAEAVALIADLAAAYAENETAMTAMIDGPAGASEEERRILADIAAVQARANPLVAGIIADRAAGQTEAALSRLAEVRPLFDDWLAAINRFIDHHEALNRQIGAEVHAGASGFRMLSAATLAVALVLAMAAGWLVARSIVRPLDRLATAMRAMAQGDYARTVPHLERRDEVGDMAQTVEVFRQNGLRIAEMTEAALDAKYQLDAVARTQAVIEFETDGTIRDANDTFCAAMGYARDEIRGRHHRMFIDPAEAAGEDYGRLWARLARGEAMEGEFRRIARGGREVWIRASYTPIAGPDGRVFKVVKFASDITGRVHAVNEIGRGLGRVAQGDLDCEITEPFIPNLDRLRRDFNHSVEKLRSALTEVGGNARTIDAAAAEVRSAADDLSKRTEQQAASLEETAAALEELTATVAQSARRAEEAGALVSQTRSRAETSETIVQQAVASMEEIERSSREVASIIGVIDEIAFQTNLLALNAGVEAARAGDAGKGFAVVAQEVRALAQRATEAARDIKKLIAKSGREVTSGVELVGNTGSALQAIIGDVKEISGHIVAIVEASREQSTGLTEVNAAVGVIDQNTQQNAAMVEQTLAASQDLASEAAELRGLLGRFRLAEAATAPARAAPPKPARPAALRALPSGRGAAAAAKPATEEWSEF